MVRMDKRRLARGLFAMDGQAVQIKLQFGKLPAQRIDFNFATGNQFQFGNHVVAYALAESSTDIKAECNNCKQDYGPNRSANPFGSPRPRLLRQLEGLGGLEIRWLTRAAQDKHEYFVPYAC